LSRKGAGKTAEDAAARYLRSSGYRILERNYSTPLGEIDIVALDGDVVCFVEVRSRSGDGFGGALEALTGRKQRQVARAAMAYMKARRLDGAKVRFDFAAVQMPEGGEASIELVKNAFWPRELRSGI
jgi:putative endonuclease